MCLPKLFPRGESKRRRSMVLSKAKRFSRHLKRASRAYIWRGRWAPDSARFPATTNGGYRYGKGGGEKSERCGSVVGCVLAEAVRPLPPTLFTLLSPPLPAPFCHAFGFRGNITRKWWLACECRYHFLARYQPALPVITAPPGLHHGLLDKPPTAKVYCVFHVPSPSIRLSFSATSLIPSCSIGLSYGASLFLTVSLYLHSLLCLFSFSLSTSFFMVRPSSPCGKCPFPHIPVSATSDTPRCIELFENRPKRREITWENGYVVHRPDR